EIIAAYSAITGYDPATGAGDNGAVVLDVLNYWHSTGIAGNRIAAYVAVDPRNTRHVAQAISLFGGIYIGVDVPRSAEQQFNDHQPWDLTRWFDPIVGAHAIPILDYDSVYLTCVTWGAIQPMTWSWFERYTE